MEPPKSPVPHSLYLAPFNVSAARFSPFTPDKILLAASQHFGIVGPGALSLLQVLCIGYPSSAWEAESFSPWRNSHSLKAATTAASAKSAKLS